MVAMILMIQNCSQLLCHNLIWKLVRLQTELCDNTGEGIFDGRLKKRNIQWENCVGFSCDNASISYIMQGLVHFFLKINPK
ncbi:hypothetical protein PR048_014024 [Dryococelus australis]|uniref:Uncharacterized protein n=1 Tax=Dryococelus australis TaxID=614101 RepID=A0ABQ9HTU9_9NEOP|nr:hypothetical protein PR048_014024 [Dryococelus australis]